MEYCAIWRVLCYNCSRLYEEMNIVTTAMLLGQLALALGFLGFISRALVERMQDLGLLAGDKG